VNERQLVELFQVCNKSLEAYHEECHRTLNLLAMISQSRHSMENNAELHFQLDQERTAQNNYQRKKLELLRGLLSLASGEPEPQ
jgi:hypothetical protein